MKKASLLIEIKENHNKYSVPKKAGKQVEKPKKNPPQTKWDKKKNNKQDGQLNSNSINHIKDKRHKTPNKRQR